MMALQLRFLAGLIAVCVVAACQPQALSQRISDQQHEVASGVTLAGALLPAALPYLKQRDALLIDLRTQAEGTEAFAREMAQQGIDYVNVPVDRDPLKPETVRRFEAALAERGARPTLIFCASGNRAGMIWAASQVDQGVRVDDALAMVVPVATRRATREAVRAYARLAREAP